MPLDNLSFLVSGQKIGVHVRSQIASGAQRFSAQGKRVALASEETKMDAPLAHVILPHSQVSFMSPVIL